MTKPMRVFGDSKGFTLVELLVTLGLLGIVIAGGFSVYYFADRAFMRTSLTADVQADMQLAMLRITEEVRLAHSLEIKEYDPALSFPVEKDPDDVHYLYSAGGTIFLTTKQGSRVILQGDPETGFEIVFGRVENEATKEEIETMLGITLSSLHPDVDYELESELQVLNLRLQEGIEGEDSGELIRFTKSFSEEELDAIDPVARGCLYRRYVYSGNAPQLVQLRSFRDNYLAKNPLGRFAIRFYYSAAPILTSFLDERPLARDVTSALLRSLAEAVIWLT